MTSKTKIFYVILTWNSEKYIERCLNSIFSIKEYSHSVVIVDNGSIDLTKEKIKTLIQQNFNIELIELSHNLGTTMSRNIALKRVPVSTDFICVLDSDTSINAMALGRMISCLQDDSKNGIIGPKMVGEDGEVQNSGRKIPTLTIKILKAIPGKWAQLKGEQMERYFSDSNLYEVGYLMSACWLMKKSVLETVGLFDENIFYAPEDVDFCIRVWKNGYKVLYENDAQIIHSWQRLSKKKFLSRHNFEHIKGLLYLFCKHHYFFSTAKLWKIIGKGL